MTRDDLKALDQKRREVARLRAQHEALQQQLRRAHEAMQRGQDDEAAQQAVAYKQREAQALSQKLQTRQAAYEAQVRALEQALCALRPGEREVVWLRYIEGLSWDEIEQRAGYTRAYCYKLHARAIRALWTSQERQTRQERQAKRAHVQQADRQRQVYERAVDALYDLAFGVPEEGEKPPTPAERMKAIEMLARLCRLFDPPENAQAREADLSFFTQDELRRIAGL